MELQDRYMEWLLARFDRVMDVVTFGLWSKRQGNVTWTSEIKIKGALK